MNALRIKTIGISALFTLLSLLPALQAQDVKAGIKERMKGRFAKIIELKKEGKVGESPKGFLATVKPKFAEDSVISAIVSAENEDRKLLYGLLGQESETPAEEVGMANAKRIFQKAPETDYFMSADGEWRMKKKMDLEKPE